MSEHGTPREIPGWKHVYSGKVRELYVPDESRLAATGAAIHDDAEVARRELAQQIAFYSSVKSYETVLDVNGFASEGRAIRQAFAQRDFPAMFAAVSEEMIDAMGVAGTAHEVREQLRRYNGVLDHIMLYSPSVGITAERVQQNLDSIIRECSPASMSPGRSCPRST